jgi:carbon storage regulator
LLVLTRHVHQSIVIGHDVIVTVLEVRGDQVRLGITAPKDIQVHREEVFAALTAANRQAATSASELEVLKELSSVPISSSKDAPRQRLGTSAGAPPSPRRGPGLASPTNPDSGPGQQPTAGPGSGPQSGTGPGSVPSASASPASSPAGPSTSGLPTASPTAASPTAPAQQDPSE